MRVGVASMFVDLSKFPDQNKTYTVDFPQLDGGWNINVRGYKLPQNESPNMKNLWWQDGLLRCRDGQSEVPTQTPPGEPILTGQTYAVYSGTFYGFGFVHIGKTVYYFDPTAQTVTYHPMLQNINPTRGVFFRYKDDLFYKNGAWTETISAGEDNAQRVTHHGGYYRIRYMPEDDLRFVMSDVSSEAYIPTIIINADPRTCAGDLYQPENRLSSRKKVQYSPGVYDETQEFAGNGSKTAFTRIVKATLNAPVAYVYKVYVDGTLVATSDYTVSGDGSVTPKVTFTTAPASDAKIQIKYRYSDSAYAVPVTGFSENSYVVVVTTTGNGKEKRFSSEALVKLSDDYSSPVGLREERLSVQKVFRAGVWVPESEYALGVGGSFSASPPCERSWNAAVFPSAPAKNTELKFYISVYQRYRTTAAEQVFVGGAEYAPTTQTISAIASVAGQTQYQLPKDGDGQYPIVGKVSYSPQPSAAPDFTYDRSTGVLRLSFALNSGITIQPAPAGTFHMDSAADKVWLNPSPSLDDAAIPNSVEIVFEAPNPDARSAIMDCCYATTGGGQDGLCILLGGCPAQPNAVFWNSNDSLSMNPAYFPLSYYNLVGDTEDAITGFGRQYSDMIVFKERSLCKLEYSTQTVDGRDAVSFAYRSVNAQIGCDLPQTIQLIENNLVFCNTYTGAHILLSSSAAYENNVAGISLKVNGDPERETRGLLYDVRHATAPVISFDDDHRYWLLVDGHAYLWDYEISGYKDPSWFYLDSLKGAAYFRDEAHELYHVGDWGNRPGRLTKFTSSFSDYGQPISKCYEFPTQLLGGLSRLKDVTKVVLSFGADTAADIKLTYLTNLETREDRTDAHVPGPGASAPVGPCVTVRRPGCRHVRAFAMRLENQAVGQDLAIVSAQLQYTYQGMDR